MRTEPAVALILRATLGAQRLPAVLWFLSQSVGGDMFSTCVDALAPKGVLIIIGMMSQYASGWAPSSYPGLTGGVGWVGRGGWGGVAWVRAAELTVE